MTTRELKALELAARVRFTFKDGNWFVPAQSQTGDYKITFKQEGSTCTCEDWTLRRQDCKHIIAARLVAEREGGNQAPPINIDAPPKKKTTKRDWSVYNEAQIHEKRRFQVLLAALCKGIQELPSKGGRPRTPIADAIYACVFKIYCTFSSRRFGSDLLDAHDKGHMSKPMHPNKVNSYLETPEFTPIFRNLIMTTSLPLNSVEKVFALDSSGFSVCRFVRWFDEKYGTTRSGKDWVKAHAVSGVKTNIVPWVEILDRDAGDSPLFKRLVEKANENFEIREVVADKAYLSHENLELIDGLGGTAFIPFKTNSVIGEEGSVWEKMFLYYNLRREEFLSHYHKRSNAESVFSMMKAKTGDSVRSRTETAMHNEVYCKFICHNICVLIQSQCELKIDVQFWPSERVVEADQAKQAA